MRYFCKEAYGINADLKRHAAKETILLKKLAEAEASGNDVFIRAYKNLLAQLRQSKAEVAAKLGKS
jgi:hypothetical protein